MAKLHRALVLGVIAAGCGGGGDDITSDEYPEAFISAQCANQVECEAMPDEATCEGALILDSGGIDTLLNAIDDGTVEFDAGAAEACLDALRGRGCEFPGFYGDDPCNDVFVGTLAVGDACIIDVECQGQDLCQPTDTNCDPSTACCPGTCTAGVIISAIGGPCNDDAHACDFETSFCAIPAAGGAGTCTAPLTTEGATCEDIDACANPMYCDIFSTSTCTAPPLTGEDCSNDELLPCSDGRDYCDDLTGKCTASVDVGGTCGGANGALCVGFASCTAGACVANPGIGGTCDEADDTCLGSLSCVGVTCAAPPPTDVCN